ncbi:universal stress protein [Paeniglutamicibacter sp. NPDC012692]|uniref:universal stress protein n=1 Tax=Paeniglutamicibacter sp. NPDC012692 TaxID=3364388 RepID=UPI0036737401
MSLNEVDRRGPLIVGVIPGQHPEVVAQASLLAEQLERTIIFVYVEPLSHSRSWNLTVMMNDLPVPPLEIEEDMSTNAFKIFTTLGALMGSSSATWILRIVGGEPWTALIRLASENHGSMFVVGTRKLNSGAHTSESLNGAVAAHLTDHQRLPVLVVPASAKN